MRSTKSLKSEAHRFDYANTGWPRDFDIRIEVAEQQEILKDWRRFKESNRVAKIKSH